MRHNRSSALKISAPIKIMQTVLKPVTSLCPFIFSGLLHPFISLHYCFTHSKCWILYIHHHSSVPGKSQDDVRLDPALPYRPASCYFGSSASVPPNPAYEHRYSVGQSIRSPQLGWICESMSSSHSYTDLPLSMSFLPLHITFEES